MPAEHSGVVMETYKWKVVIYMVTMVIYDICDLDVTEQTK